MLYVLPIMLADRYYNDDISRSLLGVSGWIGDGRPLTEFIMIFINFGRPLADISPLPLILSAFFLAFAITSYITVKLPDADISPLLVYAGALVMFNPFLLPCLSYKFDCLTMVLSICLSFAIHCVSFKKIIPGILLHFAASLAILCLFQPSIGLYAALFVMEIFLFVVTGKDGIGKLIRTLSAYAVGGAAGILCYLAAIAPATVDKKGWRAEASKMDFSPESLKDQSVNIINIFMRYCSGLTKSLLIPLILFIVLALTALIMFCKEKNTGAKKCVLSVILLFITPFCLLFVSVLPLLFLNSIGKSDHMLTGFCVVMLFFGLAASFSRGMLKKALIIIMIPCIIFNYSYAFSYGNALKCQKEYEDFVIRDVAEDIQKADPDRECEKIVLTGSMPKCRELKLLCDKYPQFSAIVPVYMFEENWIGTAPLNHYLQQQLMWNEISDEDRDYIKNNRPFSSNSVYRLYRRESSIILCFDR
ncbi:MAG: glucosyltransferase domain-containing protein [Lachnospiraceae bacterium]|nr:glucosyltransferase domain-containing protein [Lachnospiraceae bacterium]